MSTRAVKQLANESYINLATFRRNGKAVETPVWFAIIDGKLYVVTDGTSAKVKRIRATKKIRVAPCSARGGVTGAWVDGTKQTSPAPTPPWRRSTAGRCGSSTHSPRCSVASAAAPTWS